MRVILKSELKFEVTKVKVLLPQRPRLPGACATPSFINAAEFLNSGPDLDIKINKRCFCTELQLLCALN